MYISEAKFTGYINSISHCLGIEFFRFCGFRKGEKCKKK